MIRRLRLITAFAVLASLAHAQDTRIDENSGTAEQSRPAVAMHARGHLVIAWEDQRNDAGDVYYQVFARRGQKYPGKDNQLANDDATATRQSHPAIAMDGRGHFVIVWCDARGSKTQTYARAFYANGTPKGPGLCAYDGADPRVHYTPDVAADRAGNCTVVWNENRGGTDGNNIYAQRFDPGLTRAGANFIVHAQASGEQIEPRVDMNGNGRTVVAWTDDRSGTRRIWARRFSSSGSPIGDEFEASVHGSFTVSCRYPCVAVHNDGSFTIGWAVTGGGSPNPLYACTFDSSGGPACGPFRVDEEGKFTYTGAPEVTVYPGGRTLFVWSGTMGEAWHVFTRLFNSQGQAAGLSHAVNETGANAVECKAAADSSANVIHAYQRHVIGNSDQGDVYAAWEGLHKPNDIFAGDGFDGMVPVTWEPSYAENENVKYTVWRASSTAGPMVPIATVDPSTRLVPGSMLDYLDRSVTNGHTYYYLVQIEGETATSRIFSAAPSAAGHSFGSRWASAAPAVDGVLSAGEWQGAASRVIAPASAVHAVVLYVMNDAGKLYIAVDDSNDVVVDAGNQLAVTFDDNHSKTWPPAGTAGEGMIVVSQSQATYTNFWGTYPNALGGSATSAAAGVTSAVSSASGRVQYELAVDLAASPLKASPGQTIGIGIRIKDPGTFYWMHYDNAGEWPLGMLWEAAETMGGLTLAVNTGIASETDIRIPGAFSLRPAYPNPFNPSTTVSFDVAEPCRVVLTVCDANGREMAKPADGPYSPGRHQAVVDASAWPAGIYFCRIRAGEYQAVRKMALVK